jgi:hypothetical protein
MLNGELELENWLVILNISPSFIKQVTSAHIMELGARANVGVASAL